MSTDVDKVTSDVSKQYEELKQLIIQKKPRTRISQGAPTQSAFPRRISAIMVTNEIVNSTRIMGTVDHSLLLSTRSSADADKPARSV